MSTQRERQRTNKIKLQLGVIILLAFFIIGINWPDSEESYKAPLTDSQHRQERIKSCFDSWDGSHIELVKSIKESMNDPDSYDHIETKYWDRDSVLFIITSFRGRNAFGGIVKQTVSATANMRCTIIEIQEL